MKLVRYQDWGLYKNIPGSGNLALPVAEVYIHHTVTPRPLNEAAEITSLRDIDKQHRRQGWDGIGYNFIVGPSGTVYEGRGQRVGAHNDGENDESFGIAFLGEFTNAVPTPAAMIAAAELMQVLITPAPDFGLPGGALTPSFAMRGHRDADATACPGNQLYAQLPSLRGLVNHQPPAPKENPVSHPIVNAPVTGIGVTPTGQGYYLVCADGGVFAFGDAIFFGRVEYLKPADDGWTPDDDGR